MRVKKEIPAPKVSRPVAPPKTQAAHTPGQAARPSAVFDQKPAAKGSTTAAHRVLQTRQIGELATTPVDWSSPHAAFDRLGGDGAASLVAGLVGLGQQGFPGGIGDLIQQGLKLMPGAGGDVKGRLEEALDALGVLQGQKPDALNLLDLSKLQTAVSALRDAGAARGAGLESLAIGSSGEGVKALQGLLNHAMPGIALSPDGKFGPLTQDAVKVFQGQNGLKATGAMNAETAAKLESVAALFAERVPFSHGPYQPDPALDGVRSGEQTLGLGQQSPAVAALHTALNSALPGALGLPPNSTFTDMTQSAVRLFQGSTGLPVDGEVTRPVTEFLDNVAGKANFDQRKAEAAVRTNKAREKAVSIEDIKKDPDAFLKGVVQIDGHNETGLDVSSCGPTALLMGMIAGRPESMVELGKKLMDDQGNITPAGQKLLADADSPVMKATLKNLRDGKFSPRDVTYLAESMRGKMGTATGGVTAQELMGLRSAITSLGVSVPRMELQQFGPPDGTMGHWRVAINDKQYNPWPNAKGQSTVLTGPSSLGDGASDWPGGQLREKLYIDDTTVAHNVYAVTSNSRGNIATSEDPPLFVTRYERSEGGAWKRVSTDQTGMVKKIPGGASQGDIDGILPREIPSRL